MRIFISWSGDLSRSVAEVLRDWLPDVIQALDPWMSSEDIEAGARWSAEIANQLDGNGQGLVVVTQENLGAPWLNFEAGALSKSVLEGQPRPVLVDLKKASVVGPLSQFQLTEIDDQADMHKLLRSLNSKIEAGLATDRLDRAYEKAWPALRERVESARARCESPQEGQSAQRSAEDMLEELLTLVRELSRHRNQQTLSDLEGVIRADPGDATGLQAAAIRRWVRQSMEDDPSDANRRLAWFLKASSPPADPSLSRLLNQLRHDPRDVGAPPPVDPAAGGDAEPEGDETSTGT